MTSVIKELTNKVRRQDFESLTKDDLVKALQHYMERLSLATDFTQSEMDEKNVCSVCDTPYHPDYCYNREQDEVLLCDVCHGLRG